MSLQMTRYNNEAAAQTRARFPTISARNVRVQTAKRLQVVAARNSRRNVHQARAEAAQMALTHFIDLCYQTVADGLPALVNVSADGRILVPVPWGRHHTDYGLQRTEARGLGWEMMNRCAPELDHVPLCTHDQWNGQWYLNNRGYPTHEDALEYLNRYSITVAIMAGYERWKAGR